MYLLKKVLNPVTLLKKIWDIYALPAILYGAEVVMWTKEALEKLDQIQRAMIRSVFRLPSYTANAACYGISGIKPVEYTLTHRRIAYFSYLLNLPDERWASLALEEQSSWITQDRETGALYDNNNLNRPKRKYWLTDTYALMHKYNIEWRDKYTSSWLRDQLNNHYISSTRAEINTRSTLRNFDDNLRDGFHEFSNDKYGWWLKARTEGIYLRHRNPRGDQKGCLMCGAERETLVHFIMECEVLNRTGRLWTTPQFTPEYCVAWALSHERSLGYKGWINGWLKERWKERTRRMEMARDPGTANGESREED